MQALKGQLTLRGVAIGCVGCAIITAASAYTALKMGALPWPIIFAAIISLFFLKALGHTNLNEANVTHTVMSAGAMVAGGLAFTIPGAWMLGHAAEIDWFQMLAVALAGVVLEPRVHGSAAPALHRGRRAGVPHWPGGRADARRGRLRRLHRQEAVRRHGAGGPVHGAAGRVGRHPLPAVRQRGPAGRGVWGALSPMLLAVGFLVGTGAVAAMVRRGAHRHNFGIVVGGTAAGLWDVAAAQGIVSSLGMGVMMGCGTASSREHPAEGRLTHQDTRGSSGRGPR